MTLFDTFWDHVQAAGPDDCWPWTRCTDTSGYGNLRHDGTLYRCHRLAWEMHNGRPIPAGQLIRHTCDNPPCCNPSHLLTGTYADNNADTHSRGRARPRRGEQTWSARLTEADVRTMRAQRAAGTPLGEIAAQFGVHRAHASKVTTGKRWAHLEAAS